MPVPSRHCHRMLIPTVADAARATLGIYYLDRSGAALHW
jgi:hypothetical protein